MRDIGKQNQWDREVLSKCGINERALFLDRPYELPS